MRAPSLPTFFISDALISSQLLFTGIIALSRVSFVKNLTDNVISSSSPSVSIRHRGTEGIQIRVAKGGFDHDLYIPVQWLQSLLVQQLSNHAWPRLDDIPANNRVDGQIFNIRLTQFASACRLSMCFCLCCYLRHPLHNASQEPQSWNGEFCCVARSIHYIRAAYTAVICLMRIPQ